MKQLFALNKHEFSNFWKSSSKLKTVGQSKSLITANKLSRITHSFHPQGMLSGLEIETTFIPQGTESVSLELSPYGVIIDAAGHFSYVNRTNMSNYLKSSTKLMLRRGELNSLKVTYNRGRVYAKLNDQPAMTFKSQYMPTCDQLVIEWPSRTIIKSLAVKGQLASNIAIPQKSQTYQYHATLDLPDDLIPNPFNKTTLERMMKRLAELGLKRLYWIYYGNKQDGCWLPAENWFMPNSHITQTMKNLGDDFLKAAVPAAHKAGLEIYAVIKPFDIAYNITAAPNSERAAKYGKADVLGGKTLINYPFVADHPEYCLRAKPQKKTRNHPITRIELESAHVPDAMPQSVVLWASSDNQHFCPVQADYEIKIQKKRITISGLNITEPYLAIQLPDSKGKNSFINTMDNLVHVYDSQANLVDFTYGLMPRTFRKFVKDQGYHMDYVRGQIGQIGGDFESYGFFFDFWPGVPSSLFCGQKTRLEGIPLDNEFGVIGIARGRNEFVPGVMCPSHRPARQSWLKTIEQALSHGVDGIDIRRMHHSNVLNYPDYGFNPPVVREFKKRYNVDPTKESFDISAWRELRGEYYTQFLREAASLIHEKGKKLQVHISDILEGSPDSSAPQEIYCNWKTWITEKICDEVTFKAANMDAYKKHMGLELINLCQQNNIPIYYCPFVHRTAGVLSRKDWKTFLSRTLPSSGVNGFIIYEVADLVYAAKGNRIMDRDPELASQIKKLACNSKESQY